MNKWGGTTKYGFTAVSRAFLRSYSEMGVTADEALLVIHIIDFAWDDQLPFPSVATLAALIGRSENTVRAYIKGLRSKGLVTSSQRNGWGSNEYDFTPLFERIAAWIELNRKPKQREVRDSAKVVPATPTQNLGRAPTQNSSNPPPQNLGTDQNMSDKNNSTSNATRVTMVTAVSAASVISDAIARAKLKTETGTQRTLERKASRPAPSAPVPKAKKDLNANTLYTIWRSLQISHQPEIPIGSATMRDRALLKSLINEFTPTKAEALIRGIYERHRDVTRACKLPPETVLTSNVIYGYRKTMAAVIFASMGQTRGVEYDSNTTEPSEGW